MTRIHEGLPSKEFEKPASVEKLSVCEETGLLPRAGCPVITEYFDVGTMPTETSISMTVMIMIMTIIMMQIPLIRLTTPLTLITAKTLIMEIPTTVVTVTILMTTVTAVTMVLIIPAEAMTTVTVTRMIPLIRSTIINTKIPVQEHLRMMFLYCKKSTVLSTQDCGFFIYFQN